MREDQRDRLVRTLGEAQDLVIEVHYRPATVLIRDGDRGLLKIPARVFDDLGIRIIPLQLPQRFAIGNEDILTAYREEAVG